MAPSEALKANNSISDERYIFLQPKNSNQPAGKHTDMSFEEAKSLLQKKDGVVGLPFAKAFSSQSGAPFIGLKERGFSVFVPTKATIDNKPVATSFSQGSFYGFSMTPESLHQFCKNKNLECPLEKRD